MSAIRFVALGACCWLLASCVSSAGKKPSAAEAATANMNLAVGYLQQGRADLAIERLNRAIDLNPRLALAHSTIAVAYDQQGSFDEAETHYKRATQLEPSNPDVANGFAVFLCRHNRFLDAEPYFKRAADTPTYQTPEVALMNAGVCARGAGDRVKAEEYFRAALAKSPKYPDALSSMLELSYQEKNFLQARAFLQRYMDATPANASTLLMCFNIESQLDNKDSANRCASILRERFPTAPEVAQLQQEQRPNGR